MKCCGDDCLLLGTKKFEAQKKKVRTTNRSNDPATPPQNHELWDKRDSRTDITHQSSYHAANMAPHREDEHDDEEIDFSGRKFSSTHSFHSSRLA